MKASCIVVCKNYCFCTLEKKLIFFFFLCRVEGQFSVSASNTFKLDKWHGLFLSKKHNPVDLTEEEFVDLFNTSLKWFKKANSVDRESL